MEDRLEDAFDVAMVIQVWVDMSGHGVSENTCAEKRKTDPNKIDTSRVGDEKWRYGTDTSDGDGRLETGEASQVG